MSRFDAELYLRMLGERVLLGIDDRRQRPWDSPLAEPARALVAVGAITAARARGVIDDYALADALRSEHGEHFAAMGGYDSDRSKTKPLKPRRVVPCERDIETSSGTLRVRHVTLDEDATTLAVTWWPKASNQQSGRRRRHMAMFGPGAPTAPPDPDVRDDSGATAGTHFSGGGSDEEWTGHLTTDHPLAVDSAWLEIEGKRIDLTEEAIACEVTVEDLGDEPVALRYLWRRLAAADEFHGQPPEIDDAIDALVAAGALDSDEPALAEIRAVHEAMPDHPGMQPMHRTTPGVKRLPDPWRSLISRLASHDGPEGGVVLSAVTPEFEGFTVAVSYLESEPHGFVIEAEAAPGFEGRGRRKRSLGSTQLNWWAADDRGNHYLGQVGNWSGGDGRSTGSIRFWPALHPKAQRLAIMPTAEATRAVISFPLTWSQAASRAEGTVP